MRLLKVIWIPALVGASLALSGVLLGPSSVAFAVLLNAFVLSQVAGYTQVKTVTLPDAYYRLRRIERGGAIYRYVGIRWFKRLMTSRLYRALNPHFNFKRGSESPADLLNRMREAESAHTVAFALMALCSAVALALGSGKAALWLLVFNTIGNGYPSMLQRYNRGRMARIYGEVLSDHLKVVR